MSLEATKKSVADGKTLVANAISAKGVSTATDATFATMATNIGNIVTKTAFSRQAFTIGNYETKSITIGDCYFFIYAVNGSEIYALYDYKKINGEITLIEKRINNSATTPSLSGDGTTLTIYGRYLNVVVIAL